MSACERYEADLSALLDGELDAAKEEELRAHMAECPECTALYEAFSLLHADVQEPPADLTARIMNAVRSETETNITPMPKKKQHWGKWLAAAACFVVIVGAVTLPRLLQQRPAVPTNAVSRSMPQLGQSETAPANAADSNTDADPATSDGALLTGSHEALTLTEPDEIEAVRALLSSPAEADAPAEDTPPLLQLKEADDATTVIWLSGDDVLYTDDGEQYFRCAGAANALIDFLAQYGG